MTAPIHLAPLARAIGPFADPAFLDVVHAHFPRGELVEIVADDAVVRLEDVDGTLVGVGDRDLVDYRSPLGPGALEAMVSVVAGRPLVLDSVPEPAAAAIAEALESAGRRVDLVVDDTAAVLALPATFGDWLAAIGKKERHETRRKRRRYTEHVGPVEVAAFDQPGDRLDEFIALHRSSSGAKGSFMTDDMVAFFVDLLALEAWSIRALVDPDGAMVAAGFGAGDEDGFYLYNSAFDRSHAEASPGVVLIAALIEDCIDRGLDRLDFLKGDESYKFRLGADPRPLATVRVAG